MLRTVHHVLNGDVVAATERSAVLIAICSRNRRVFEFVSIIDVGLTVVFKVLAGAFDAIVITAASDFLILGGRCVPSSLVVVFVRRWTLRHDC